jgi:hypothetical protein
VSRGVVATNGFIVLTSENAVIGNAKLKYLEKICHSATLSTEDLKRTSLRLNPDLNWKCQSLNIWVVACIVTKRCCQVFAYQ